MAGGFRDDTRSLFYAYEAPARGHILFWLTSLAYARRLCLDNPRLSVAHIHGDKTTEDKDVEDYLECLAQIAEYEARAGGEGEQQHG